MVRIRFFRALMRMFAGSFVIVLCPYEKSFLIFTTQKNGATLASENDRHTFVLVQFQFGDIHNFQFGDRFYEKANSGKEWMQPAPTPLTWEEQHEFSHRGRSIVLP